MNRRARDGFVDIEAELPKIATANAGNYDGGENERRGRVSVHEWLGC
jgi:hypothetical protein